MMTISMIFKVTQIFMTYCNRIFCELKGILISAVLFFFQNAVSFRLNGKEEETGLIPYFYPSLDECNSLFSRLPKGILHQL